MTETDWTTSAKPIPMLRFLRDRASDRKLRLFAVACCRRIRDLLPDDRCRSALETAERFADGEASLVALQEARRQAIFSYDSYPDYESDRFTGRESAAAAIAGACWTESPGQFLGLRDVVGNCYGLGRLSTGWRNGGRIEWIRQCRDIRDVFGNPFRTLTLVPAWFTPEVITIANSMYDARAFDRLPDLAQALKRANCADEAVLTHCHQTGPHVRGCWVVDAILGRS
jgi:hypothetical protein